MNTEVVAGFRGRVGEMHEYDPLALYAGMAGRLFQARREARASGGSNNIQERGLGPEAMVRNIIREVIGHRYRVTHGHVVRSDKRKSKQVDVIVVKDSPAATMHLSNHDGAELVRAEWVAAVGEVKSSWIRTSDVLDSYYSLISDIHDLHDDLRVRNHGRFGEISDETDFSRPCSGREWNNNCYTFLAVIEKCKCPVERLVSELRLRNIEACDSVMLILEEAAGGVICIPGTVNSNTYRCGVDEAWNAENLSVLQSRDWLVMKAPPSIQADQRAGYLLSQLIVDLQLHLNSWFEEYKNPVHYHLAGESKKVIVRQKT
jgi:hypothetical protein